MYNKSLEMNFELDLLWA